jgi:DNA-binding CsgD family transcriptional regulator
MSIALPMIELWNRLTSLLRLRRSPRARYFELEQSLRTALVQRADREQRPEAEVRAEALAAGLAHLQNADWLKQCWDNLTPREQEVAALTCLGYTNRQMAVRMHVSVETIKTHITNMQAKFDLHGKAELRQALEGWNFDGWGPPQE